MSDPISTLTIAAFAFLSSVAQSEPGKKYIESIVGKFGEKTLEAGLGKIGELRRMIGEKLRGNVNAERAIAAADEGNEAAIEDVADYLKVAMKEDPDFATQIQQVAQEIINIGKIEGRNVQNISGGQGMQVNDPRSPVIQAGENAKFYFGSRDD